MSKKQKRFHGFQLHWTLTYFSSYDYLLCFICCFCFVSWNGFRYCVGIASFAGGLKICVRFTGIKKYKSIITQKRKKHDKRVLSAKKIEVLISKDLYSWWIYFGKQCIERFFFKKKKKKFGIHSMQG